MAAPAHPSRSTRRSACLPLFLPVLALLPCLVLCSTVLSWFCCIQLCSSVSLVSRTREAKSRACWATTSLASAHGYRPPAEKLRVCAVSVVCVGLRVHDWSHDASGCFVLVALVIIVGRGRMLSLLRCRSRVDRLDIQKTQISHTRAGEPSNSMRPPQERNLLVIKLRWRGLA